MLEEDIQNSHVIILQVLQETVRRLINLIFTIVVWLAIWDNKQEVNDKNLSSNFPILWIGKQELKNIRLVHLLFEERLRLKSVEDFKTRVLQEDKICIRLWGKDSRNFYLSYLWVYSSITPGSTFFRVV